MALSPSGPLLSQSALAEIANRGSAAQADARANLGMAGVPLEIPTAALLGGMPGAFVEITIGSGITLLGSELSAGAGPGGSSGQLQINNAGALAGLSIGDGLGINDGTIAAAVASVAGRGGDVTLAATDVAGVLARANNLSELSNPPQALSNLGIGPGGTLNTGVVDAQVGNFATLTGTQFNTFVGTAAALNTLTLTPSGTLVTIGALIPDIAQAAIDGGGANVAGFVDIDGRHHFGSVVANAGSVALLNSGSVVISGSASAATLGVSGGATAGSLTIAGAATLNGSVAMGSSASVAGAMSVGGSFSVGGAFNPTSIGFSGGGTVAGFQLTPDINSLTQDGSLNVNRFTDQVGIEHFGSIAAKNVTVSGNLAAPGFSPVTLPFNTTTLANAGSFAASAMFVPDFQDMIIGGSGTAVAGGYRGSGALHVPLSPVTTATASQGQVKRTFRMTQMCPTLIGATFNVADTGDTTYFLCCTLDTSGFDAVRLLIGCGVAAAGQTITAIAAVSASLNDYVNPIDNNGTAVPWTPVTFNSGGVDIDWADQSLGLGLPISQASTAGTTLYFASGVSAIAVGAPASGKGLTAGSTVVSTNPGVSPQQVVLSAAPDYTDLAQSVGQVISFGTIGSTITACPTASAFQFTLSDWTGLSTPNPARSDGGTFPVLMVRIHATGNPTPINVSPNSGTLHAGWGNIIGDRVWSCYSQSGNFVTSPAGAAPGADDGKMLVVGVQYMSRSRGVTILGVGDSVLNGVNNAGGNGVSGTGAGCRAAMRISSPNCPVTWCTLGSWGVNNAGVCEVYYPTAKANMALFAPNVLALQSWSRNDFLTSVAFTQADADWQWQQNMMLAEKASATWGTQPLVFGSWPNNSMTSSTDAYRISSLSRGAQVQAGGGMFVNTDSLVGAGGNPNTWLPQFGTTGLHLPPYGQDVAADSMDQLLKSAIGIP